MTSSIEQFRDAMRSICIEPPQVIHPDGKLHRFTSGEDKSANSWYILHDDGNLPAGAFGCWKRNLSETWSAKEYKSLTHAEKAAYTASMEAVKRLREQELQTRRAECITKATSMLAAAKEPNRDHPYLVKKGIQPFGAKQLNDLLLVPVRKNKSIVGLQTIAPDGTKKFLTGTEKGGAYLAIAGAGDTVYLCEGWATGCTIHEATGASVIVCFDCGNLEPVAMEIRAKGADYKLVICADNDRHTDSNPGLTKATTAALAVDGLLAVPDLPDGAGTDFNDLHKLSGLEEVKRQLLLAKPAQQEAITAVFNELPMPEHGGGWPEPLLFGEIETPEIKPDLLPEPLSSFCQAVTDSCQTPASMAVMMGLAVVATCLQKRFEVAPFGSGYTEPVNLMTCTALDPASRKSAVVKYMTEPLTAWENQQADLFRDHAAKVRHERDMILKTIEATKAAASKASATDDDRREALTEIRRLEDSLPPEVIIPRLWLDDVTIERLQNLLADNGERISLISAEGGVFEVLAGLYSGGKSNVNVILQSHAGEPVRVERQGRSVMMNKPAMSFGLCVQPSIISDLASGNKARFRGNGMLARLLYCIPKSTVGSRNVAKHKPVQEQVKAAYHHLIYRLLSIPPIADEQGHERARMLTLAPDALSSWLAFAQYIESNQGQYGEFHSFQDWTGKLPGAALRIAGLCHVVEYGEQTSVINKATIEKALDLAEALIIHAKAAFELMGTDAAIPDAKFVLQWIVKNQVDGFRRGDLHKALHNKFHRVDRLKAALQVLAERNIVSEPEERPTGRRPEIFYTVNPAVLSGGL